MAYQDGLLVSVSVSDRGRSWVRFRPVHTKNHNKKSAKRHCGRHTKLKIFCCKITCLKSNYLGIVHLIVLHIYIHKTDHVFA